MKARFSTLRWESCLFLISLIFYFPTFCLAEDAKPSTDSIPQSQSIEALNDLIGVILDNDTMSLEVPQYLSEIVDDYYAEAIVGDEVPGDVLSFVENFYSEHGYYETGNWGGSARKVPGRRKYIPYIGELPEYEYSDFTLPAIGRLTSRYGYRPRFRRFHHGIDIALNYGDPVVSALPGVVKITGYDPGGYGCFVIVAHKGDIETIYGHLSSSLVTPGQQLDAGEALGKGGSSGNSTGAHLHFETRYLGASVDPIIWFNLSFE